MIKQRFLVSGISIFMLFSLNSYPQSRKPAAAGSFYPEDKNGLKNMITNFLGRATVSIDGEICGLIVPHAGYIYSGQTASYAYKLLQNKNFDIVILLGAGHYVTIKTAAIYSSGKFLTPLGEVEIDNEFTKKLLETKHFENSPQAHQPEHSLEVQLPFLQMVLKKFKIVPILMNNEDLNLCKTVGVTLGEIIQDYKKMGVKILLIISTDLSHYPPSGVATYVDSILISNIENFEVESIFYNSIKFLQSQVAGLSTTACGEAALISGLYTLKTIGAKGNQVLAYANSGQLPFGDYNKSVGYVSMVFTYNEQKKYLETSEKFDFKLDKIQQKKLLNLARKTLENTFKTGEKFYEIKLPQNEDHFFKKNFGVFVTLRKGEALRGCIGNIFPEDNLWNSVNRLVCLSAFEDRRFKPLQKQELKDIKIEISVLSQPKKVLDIKEIIPFKTGVIVKSADGREGVFLPSVWEQIPQRECFMAELCSQKAGLLPDEWLQKNLEILKFYTFSFEE